MAQVIELRHTEGREAALEMLSEGPSRTRMVAIRDTIARLKAEEERVLSVRVDDTKASALDSFATLSLLILLDVVLLGSLFFVVRRDLAERRRVLQALTLSRERYELAVQGSRDGLWDWDIMTDEVYFSPQWKAQIGYEDHEIRGHFEEWRSRVHPDDRDRAMATLQAYLDGGLPIYELEHRLRHKDGSFRWIRAGPSRFGTSGAGPTAWPARTPTSPRGSRPSGSSPSRTADWRRPPARSARRTWR